MKVLFRPITFKIALVTGTFLFFFIIIEIAYRIIDPFPYISQDQINKSEYGNLSKHDPILEWKGVPAAKTKLTTENNSVWLEHNQYGFRDIEHETLGTNPAIVFLGDSFTWGYEVESDEMFVNLLRDMLPEYEIFNLSHRGYGTDQELLVFKNWEYTGLLKWVILMFSENDIDDNNSKLRYEKLKPRFEIQNDDLVLTGVPVPKIVKWEVPIVKDKNRKPIIERIKDTVLRSHVLHEIYFQYNIFNINRGYNYNELQRGENDYSKEDIAITYEILKDLKKAVEMRGAELIVVMIPSKLELMNLPTYQPYQNNIKEICNELDIKNYDLIQEYENYTGRTYYRKGGHLTPLGHKVVADSTYNYLIREHELKENF